MRFALPFDQFRIATAQACGKVPVCVVGCFLTIAECSYMVYCLLVPSIGSARQHPVYATSVFWVGVESTLVRAKIGVVSSHNK